MREISRNKKLKAKVGENERAILNGVNCDPVNYDWVFNVLRGKYREPAGVPIVRIAGKLGGIEKVIYRELEPWVRNPEGVWGWIGKKRSDLKTSGRHLANREVYN